MKSIQQKLQIKQALVRHGGNMSYLEIDESARHIVSLSGGKDSTALAVYLKNKVPNLEYVFCDTGSELTETYEYLDRVESYLGKKIVRLNSGKIFEEYLNKYMNYLPSPMSRWCTAEMKIKPYEEYVGMDKCVSYVGIRADENREGYVSKLTNIKPEYPFKEDGIDRAGVYKILEDSGLGLPKYYEWRSRSGCYFCFFQRTIEWVGLLEKHPELFKKAEEFEKMGYRGDEVKFTWVNGRTLDWIRQNKEKIKESHRERMLKASMIKRNLNIHDVFEEAASAESSEKPCDICDI